MVGTFFVLGYSDLPIMIYSHLEGGCECVQRRCHESRIPGRHNIYDIPLYVIMCHHNMFSCNLFLFKIKEFPRNAWNMTKHHHRGKYIYMIYHLSYLSFNFFPLTILMFRWAIVLALLVTILVGVIIVLCLRKRKLAMGMNSQVSQVSQEEQRKTKDLEQSYSLIGERWDPCFWFNNSIYISKQQNLCTWILFCKVFSGKIISYHEQDIHYERPRHSFWHRQPGYIIVNEGLPRKGRGPKYKSIAQNCASSLHVHIYCLCFCWDCHYVWQQRLPKKENENVKGRKLLKTKLTPLNH